MTSLVLMDTAIQRRRRFITGTAGMVGAANIRALWMPSPTEGLSVVDGAVASRLWTHGATPNGRLRPLGNGVALSFNGTSDYLGTPDALDLSFNGTTDAPFSIVSLVNVTNTAAGRTIIGKLATSNIEYAFRVMATDVLEQALFDQSVGVSPDTQSNAAVTQGSWVTLGMSYSGVGGATAAAGITLYQNGATVAQTPVEQVTYVAMENLTAPLEIGAEILHTASFFSGSMAFVMLVGANLTAAQHLALKKSLFFYHGLI